jgi:hypothetical protein
VTSCEPPEVGARQHRQNHQDDIQGKAARAVGNTDQAAKHQTVSWRQHDVYGEDSSWAVQTTWATNPLHPPKGILINMAINLFITYDLNKAGKNYDGVINAIKSLSKYAKYQKSAWYVRSAYTATQVADHIWKEMDADDHLMVIDATNNSATWRGPSTAATQYISDNWNS